MRTLSLAAAGLSFVGVAGTTLYVWRLTEKRLNKGFLLRRLHLDRERSRTLLQLGWLEALTTDLLVPLGRTAAPKGEEESAAVRRQLRQAGYRSGRFPGVEAYYGLRVLLALILGSMTLAWMTLAGGFGPRSLLNVFLPLAAGYYLPAAVLQWQASVRSRKIGQELPDVLDLLKICIEAGLSLDSALFRVGRELKDIAPVLSRELAQYFLEIQSGLPRKEVLSNLAERNQVNALSGVVNVLIQSSRLGTDIAEALEVYSVSLRTERMQAAQEQGAKVSTKLTFPMIFLILPALLIVILGPAMINMFDRLSRLF